MKVAILAGLIGILLLGCGPDYSVCEFEAGQMVRSKVSGEVGQVIVATVANATFGYEDWCYAHVRFRGNQAYTDSRILSNDGPITVRGLTVVKYMRPYELERVE